MVRPSSNLAMSIPYLSDIRLAQLYRLFRNVSLGKDQAGVICRSDGCLCACTNKKNYPGGPPGSARAIMERCALRHEEEHVNQHINSPCCHKCVSSGSPSLGRHAIKGWPCSIDKDECEAHQKQVNCLVVGLYFDDLSDKERNLVISEIVEVAVSACSNYDCTINLGPWDDVIPKKILDQIRQACQTRGASGN